MMELSRSGAAAAVVGRARGGSAHRGRTWQPVGGNVGGALKAS